MRVPSGIDNESAEVPMTLILPNEEINHQYRKIFESLDQGFCIIEILFDKKGKPVDYRFLDTNPAFEKHTGLNNAIGKTVREFAPNHEEYWFEIYGKIALTGEPAYFENAAKQLDRYYKVFACRFGEPGVNQVAVIFNDISKQQKTEIELKKTLAQFQDQVAEREVLLRELYHRTKNNMQVISSLLSLRESKLTDEIYRSSFIEMRNRIQAMSLVHEMLYRTHSLSSLDLSIYIKDLVELLVLSHSDEKRINTFFHLISIEVPIDVAIPCGLVITELVLNVIKYAFPGEGTGNLEITLSRTEGGLLKLIICDDGIGIPDNRIDDENSFGIQIVKGLVQEQLRGEITLDTIKGTCWHISFLG